MKRFLSGWLALCMILSLLPVQTFARSEAAEEVAEIAQEVLTEEVVEEAAEEETAEEIVEEVSEEPAEEIGQIGGISEEAANSGITSGKCGDDLTWDYADGTLTIEGTGEMWDIGAMLPPWEDYVYEITQIVVTEGVRSIGKQAFYGCDAVTQITLPEGLLKIDDAAFMGCYSVKQIVFPNTLTTIGKQAFYQCFGLEEVDIPAGVTQIGEAAFGICTELTCITVNSANQYYSSDENGYLFSKDKTVLYQVLNRASGSYTIPDSVTTIGDSAFEYCTNLTEIIIPDSVTEIGRCAFVECTSLSRVMIPDSVTEIGEFAFTKCLSLETIQLPSALERMEHCLFYWCDALESITIPDSVTEIGGRVFAQCESLKEIQLPSQLERIEYGAFEDCPALESITIPASVKFLGDQLFAPVNCSEGGVGEITFEGSLPEISATAFAGITATAYYPGDDRTWISSAMGNYGGSITWVPVGDTSERNIAVNETNFPDDNFRGYILAQDYGADGVLTPEELADVYEMHVSQKGIKNLTGIGYFWNLEELDCSWNQITELDLSNITGLNYLKCYGNQLSELDLQNNKALIELSCHGNNLTELDVSYLTNLMDLNCGSNQLTTLDVSKNTNLEYLACGYNQLTKLILGKNIRELHCTDNQLSSLDVSNLQALENLLCCRNKLTALDLSKNSNLRILECRDNKLKALDLSNNKKLTDLDCYHNKLTALNLSKNTKLVYLNCGNNKLKELNLSKNTKLESLDCSYNQLVCLDLSKNPRCSEISAYENSRQITLNEKNQFELSTLTGFDVSKASYWCEGKVSKNTLIAQGTRIQYDYQITDDYTESFHLEVKEYHYSSPKVKVKADSKTGGATLSWEDTGAVEYSIYRATSADGEYSFQKVTRATEEKVSVPAGKTYYFKIRAVYKYSKPIFSDAVKVTGKCAAPVVKAANVSSSGKIKLSWKKIEGAKEYKIYRATSKSGTYKLLKTTTSTSYTTGGTVGKTYYYKVKAIHKDSGANSAYSAIVSCTLDLARPNVSIKLKNGDPKLSWDKISGASKYYVYRATSKDGSYKKVKSTTKLTWTDTDAKAGKTYYYKVKAIHKNTSANSAYSSVDKIKAK